MTYADSAWREPPFTRYGFLLEDDRDLAARNRDTLIEQQGLLQEDIDSQNMGLVAVFQYMIANTDWSVWGLHNIKLLRDSAGATYAVPYDFDWSGVIAPPYARPDPRLGAPLLRRLLQNDQRPARDQAGIPAGVRQPQLELTSGSSSSTAP